MLRQPIQISARALIDRLEGAAGRGLIASFSWYGLAELASRVSRLIATVILARTLNAAELGLAASALATFEIIRVLANNGLGPMLIRAREEELPHLAEATYRVGWTLCLLMAVIEVGAAAGLAQWTGRPELFAMTACLAGVFLLMPLGLVSSFLIQRENKVKRYAAVATGQVIVDNALTALLAILGLGAWAVVLPKLLTAPIWVFGMRWLRPWTRDPKVTPTPLAPLFSYALPVLLSEIVASLRANLDKLIVGNVLGLEVLGLYYFAYNAGVGLSTTLTSALSNSVYPYLAAAAGDLRELLHRYDTGARRMAYIVGVIILAQAAASFIYVPVIFGSRWAPATPLVALMCLSATTKPFQDSATQLLRAAGFTRVELSASAILTVISLGVLATALHQGLYAGVAAMAAAMILTQLLIAAWARDMVAGEVAASSPAGAPALEVEGLTR